jgi:hypothetical protein
MVMNIRAYSPAEIYAGLDGRISASHWTGCLPHSSIGYVAKYALPPGRRPGGVPGRAWPGTMSTIQSQGIEQTSEY